MRCNEGNPKTSPSDLSWRVQFAYGEWMVRESDRGSLEKRWIQMTVAQFTRVERKSGCREEARDRDREREKERGRESVCVCVWTVVLVVLCFLGSWAEWGTTMLLFFFY